MTPAAVIRVQVVRAWPRRHEMVNLALPDTATVADAVVASGFMPEGLARDGAGEVGLLVLVGLQQVGRVKERALLLTDVDERGLEAGLDAGDEAFIDVALALLP